MFPRTRLNITLYVHFLSCFTSPKRLVRRLPMFVADATAILKGFCNIFGFSFWAQLFLNTSIESFFNLCFCCGHSDIHHHTVCPTTGPQPLPQPVVFQIIVSLTLRHRIKSRLPFAGIIRSSPYSPSFQDKG